MFKIQELHAKYGPFLLCGFTEESRNSLEIDGLVIRIGPSELYVNDSSFYEVLYVGPQHEREIGTMFGDMFRSFDTFPAIISHDHRRLHRSAYNAYFSPTLIRREPIIREKIFRLLRVFNRYRQDKTPVPLNITFGAATGDIVTDYCFGTDENYTETPNFDNLIMQSFYSSMVDHVTTSAHT